MTPGDHQTAVKAMLNPTSPRNFSALSALTSNVVGWMIATAALLLSSCSQTSKSTQETEIEENTSTSLSVDDLEFRDFVQKLNREERARFVDFLKSASCWRHVCSVQDMALGNKSSLAEYFMSNVIGTVKKGLVVRESLKFSGTITVCWTDNSDASTADKEAVIDSVEATWGSYADISFDWYSSGTTPRVCNETQAASIDIVVWQDTSQTRGCSTVGNANQTGVGCTNSIPHSWATMLLEAGDIPSDSITAVHEFGHAIGFYHEQDRTDSTCSEGVNALASGARAVGNYDYNSIMNYCANKPGPFISSGDAFAAAYLYGGITTSVTFRTKSWLPTDVAYTVTPPSGSATSATQTSVSRTASDLSFGNAKTGSIVTTVPTEASLRCTQVGLAPDISDKTHDVIFASASPIAMECYSPALIVGL